MRAKKIKNSITAARKIKVSCRFYPVISPYIPLYPDSLKKVKLSFVLHLTRLTTTCLARGVFLLQKKRRAKPVFLLWSEREDSNLRPLAPHTSALPDCATLRQSKGNIIRPRLNCKHRIKKLFKSLFSKGLRFPPVRKSYYQERCGSVFHSGLPSFQPYPETADPPTKPREFLRPSYGFQSLRLSSRPSTVSEPL